MFVPTAGTLFGGVPVFASVILFAGAWAMFGPNAFDLQREERPRYGYAHGLALATILGACLSVMAGGSSSPFLYFQF
jgi:hypothetical protein